MAHTPGYQYDIFISYARDDNEVAPFEEMGWVSAFKESLEHWLIKRRHLKGLKIWFDDNRLQGNADFNAEIEQAIDQSALFFILNSRNYQDSEYCRKELRWFLEHNENKPGGIMVGNLMRPFNLLLNNIHYSEWPEVLQEKCCFSFHDAPAKTDEFGDRLEITSNNFRRQMSDLIRDTVKTLEVLAEQSPVTQAVTEDTTTSRPKIFLSNVADTLKPFQQRLINEIGDQAEILPFMPPPYETDPHREQLNQNLQ